MPTVPERKRVFTGEIFTDAVEVNDSDLWEVRFEGCIFLNGITIKDSAINRLSIADSKLVGQCVINNCRVDDIDIRIKPAGARAKNKSNLSLVKTRCETALISGFDSVNTQKATVEQRITLLNTRDIGLFSLRASEVNVDNSVDSTATTLRAADVICSGRILIRNARLNTAEFSECRLGSFRIYQVSWDDLRLDKSLVERTLSWENSGQDSAEAWITASVITDADFTSIPGDTPRECVIRCDQGTRLDSVRLSDGVAIDLAESHIKTELVVPGSTPKPIVTLDDNSYIHAVSLPSKRLTMLRGVRELARRYFTTEGSLELAVLYRSFADRPVEEDLTYYLMQISQPRTLLGRGFARLVGWLTGWGVLPSRPIGSLFLLVLATTLITWATAARTLSFFEAFIATSGMWFATGLWIPDFMETANWSGYSLLLAVGGVYFTTVIIGIAIRRLVR